MPWTRAGDVVMSRLAAFGLVCASLLSLPVSLQAQTLLSRVIDAETGAPVSGALAYLLDGAGATVRNILTDQIGRAMFVNLTEGAYRVRVEMIGRQTTESGEVVVEGSTPAQIEIRLPSRAIVLEGIEVSADERCRIRPEEGLAISRVWDEARKALEAASYTDRSDVYRYSTEMYERDLDRNARIVLAETSATRAAFMRVPFESRPAEDLVTYGFVQDGPDGGRNYFAPDATVLLSDVFLDSHCLRLEEGDDEADGLIGVTFEPAAGRGRDIADIAGTLWLDRETAELRWLSYRYVNILPGVATDLIGGRVEFRRMPDGTWIVPEWWIRMPRLVQDRAPAGGIQMRIQGYRQSGGRVVEVRDSGGDAFMRGETGTIEGFVQDSLGVLPMRGVRVGVVGSNQMVFTDDDGSFRITGLADGTYQIRFVDSRREELGLESDPIEREVVRGEVTSVFHRMPPLSDLLFEACRSESPEEGTAVLAGRVTRGASRSPLAGLSVRVSWQDFRMDPRGVPDRQITGADVSVLEIETDARGFYRLCGVPEGQLLYQTVIEAGRDLVSDTLRIPPFAGALVRNFELAP
jgi:hypothetical protein